MKTFSGEPASRAFCQNSVLRAPLTLANSWLASQVQVLPRGSTSAASNSGVRCVDSMCLCTSPKPGTADRCG